MRDRPETTLLELMHHTAGFHDNEAVAPLHAGAAETQITLAEEIARQDQVFDFAPGTAWRYSNANYIVLGAVILALLSAWAAWRLDRLANQPATSPKTSGS